MKKNVILIHFMILICFCHVVKSQADLSIEENNNFLKTSKAIPEGGYLLVCSSSPPSVLAFDPLDGTLINDSFIPADGILLSPNEVIYSRQNYSLLISDVGDNTIKAFDTDGSYLGIFAPLDGTTLISPWGIEIHPDNGNLLITSSDGRIVEYDETGFYIQDFIPTGLSPLLIPRDIKFRPDQNDFLVSCAGTDAILQYDIYGSYLGEIVAAGTILNPQQISLSTSTDNFLISNTMSPSGLNEFSNTGSYIDFYDILSALRGNIELPNGNFLVSWDGIYEIDRFNTLVDTKYTGINARYISYVNPVPVQITFRVDLQDETISPNGIHIAGTFQDPPWESGDTEMTNMVGTIYEYTLSAEPGEIIEYIYINGILWGDEEIVPPECSPFGFRDLIVPDADTILPAVCFGSCDPCNPLPDVIISFTVDMSNEIVSPEGIYIAGSFQGWDPSTDLMFDMGGDLWEYSILATPGEELEYKYFNGNTLGDAESVPGGCSMNGNRYLWVPPTDSVLNIVCFSSCEECVNPPLYLDLKVYLEGPYNGTDMNTDLNSDGYLPLSQPYNSIHFGQNNPGWYYTGSEVVDSIPNADVVDWILVELRDTIDVTSAQNAPAIARQAAFLLKDGSIVGLDGSSMLQFPNIYLQYDLFVVIWHRNHVATLSATPLSETLGIYQFDFSTNVNAPVCSPSCWPQTEVNPAFYAMNSCDGNADNVINIIDVLYIYHLEWGISAYVPRDFNMDGCALNQDIIEPRLKVLGLPPGATSQDQLTFRFANIQILPGIPEKVQFDIEVKADNPGFYFHAVQVLFDYDKLGFGQNLVNNNRISVLPIEILASGGGIPVYIFNTVDSDSNRIAIGGYQNDQGIANSIPTNFAGLFQVQMEILNPDYLCGIEFMENLMNGGQAKGLEGGSTFIDYFNDPSLYEGDIFFVDPKVYLGGPFNGTDMNTTLNSNGFIPLNSPYRASPWYYSGNDSVLSIPNPDIVDWIMLELRNADSAGGATRETIIGKKTLFLLNDGSITSIDGYIKPIFSGNITKNLYATVKHRNHLAIISADPLLKTGDTYVYDFSAGADQVYGGDSAHQEIETGIWGLIGGDANGDGIITLHDKDNFWNLQAGEKGYLGADYNMNVDAENIDKNDFWWFNLYKKTQVPGENSPPYEPSDPRPHHGAINIDIDTTLSWYCADPEEQDLYFIIYFGTTIDPPVVQSFFNDTIFSPGFLQHNTSYYWKTIAVDTHGDSTSGPVWQFSTLNRPPNQPSGPSPENYATDISIDTTLSWSCSDPDGDPLIYRIYFGTEIDPPFVQLFPTDTFYIPGTLDFDITYYWKIVALDIHGDSAVGDIWYFTSESDPIALECGDTLYDIRDGQTYNTVQIGTQCWMAENLNVGTMIDEFSEMSDDGIIEKYCYWSDSNFCYEYGGLYQLGELIQYLDTIDNQGICPEGWRVPTDLEWKILEGTVDSQYGVGDPEWDKPFEEGYRGSDAGYKLKSTTGWINDGNGSDSYGFNALPAGYRMPIDLGYGGMTLNHEYEGVFWTIKEYQNIRAIARRLNADSENIERGGIVPIGFGFSTRCIKGPYNAPPDFTSNPAPAWGADSISIDTVLSWTCSDPEGDPILYDVYFGTENIPPKVASGISAQSYNPGVLDYNTTYYWKIRAFDNHLNYTEEYIIWNFTTIPEPVFNCGDVLIDIRDGQGYNTVQIGTQCWMAENLNVGTMVSEFDGMTDDGIIEKYCYHNDSNNCNVYGAMYQYQELCQYTDSSDLQGICPDGWRIPTDLEWKILEGTVDSQYGVGSPEWDQGSLRGSDAGYKLKSTSGWINDGNGSDAYGFTVLPGGWRIPIDLGLGTMSVGIGELTMLFANIGGQPLSLLRELNFDTAKIFRGGIHPGLGTGHYVRCIHGPYNAPPDQPSNPTPANGSVEVFADTLLAWNCTDPENDPLIYDVYFGTDYNPPLIASEISTQYYNPGILDYNTTYYWKIRAFDDHLNYTEEEFVWQFTTIPAPLFDCGDVLLDIRDNKEYNTVQIGTQCWMAENLNIGNRVDGIDNQIDNDEIEKYCYNDNSNYCDTLGGLYQWNEMMEYSTSEGAQGICPAGWHIPTDNEWCTLEYNVDPSSNCNSAVWNGTDSGTKLKQGGSSGFNSLMAGYRHYTSGSFGTIDTRTYYYTSSGGSGTNGASRRLDASQTGVFKSTYHKSHGFSVRCLMD